jgi:serine/threonine-protein kinase
MAGPTNSSTSETNGDRFPKEFGRYTLLESVAVGGMGEVFLGRVEGAAGFEKTVVIKQILPHLANDPEFVRRFIAEGRLLVQLNHPNIRSRGARRSVLPRD